jgi:hypothetical protein
MAPKPHCRTFINVRTQENRTPTGRRTSAPARRATHYYAFGAERDTGSREAQQRGEWWGPDGRTQTHEAVMAWVKEQAMRHRYTFQGLLSVPEGELTAAAFCRAMQKGDQAGDWRLIAHADTDHRHAHVLWFGDKRMDKQTFLSWQAEVRAELIRLELEHPPAARLALAEGKDIGPDRQQAMAPDAGRVEEAAQATDDGRASSQGQEVSLSW